MSPAARPSIGTGTRSASVFQAESDTIVNQRHIRGGTGIHDTRTGHVDELVAAHRRAGEASHPIGRSSATRPAARSRSASTGASPRRSPPAWPQLGVRSGRRRELAAPEHARGDRADGRAVSARRPAEPDHPDPAPAEVSARSRARSAATGSFVPGVVPRLRPRRRWPANRSPDGMHGRRHRAHMPTTHELSLPRGDPAQLAPAVDPGVRRALVLLLVGDDGEPEGREAHRRIRDGIVERPDRVHRAAGRPTCSRCRSRSPTSAASCC